MFWEDPWNILRTQSSGRLLLVMVVMDSWCQSQDCSSSAWTKTKAGQSKCLSLFRTPDEEKSMWPKQRMSCVLGRRASWPSTAVPDYHCGRGFCLINVPINMLYHKLPGAQWWESKARKTFVVIKQITTAMPCFIKTGNKVVKLRCPLILRYIQIWALKLFEKNM